jgi:hypothetical protein
LDEIPPYNDKSKAWQRIKLALSNLKGRRLDDMDHGSLLINRMARGFAAFNHVVHRKLGGSCTTVEGSTYQYMNCNVSPFTVFDVDTVWGKNEFHTLVDEGVIRKTIPEMQREDNTRAKKLMDDFLERVGAAKKARKLAAECFDETYSLGT